MIEKLKNYNIVLDKDNNILTIFLVENTIEKLQKLKYNLYINKDYNIIINKNGIIEDIIVPTKNEKELLKKAKFIYIVDEKSNLTIVLKIKNNLIKNNISKYFVLD